MRIKTSKRKKVSTSTKSTKHIQANKNKKDNILMHLETSKRKKAHKQTKKRQHFHVHKNI